MSEVSIEKPQTVQPVRSAAADKNDSRAVKREEKLKVLRQKMEKALSVQSAAEKKTNDINAQIAKLESDIHNDEVKALDAVCAERNITYKQITDFLSALPQGVTLSEAAEILKK